MSEKYRYDSTVVATALADISQTCGKMREDRYKDLSEEQRMSLRGIELASDMFMHAFKPEIAPKEETKK